MLSQTRVAVLEGKHAKNCNRASTLTLFASHTRLLNSRGNGRTLNCLKLALFNASHDDATGQFLRRERHFGAMSENSARNFSWDDGVSFTPQQTKNITHKKLRPANWVRPRTNSVSTQMPLGAYNKPQKRISCESATQ